MARRPPDEATICLLQELTDDPSDREFLVAVLQTQIEMGLGSEFGALDVLGKWDDEHGRY